MPCYPAPKSLRISSRRRPRHASRPFPSLSLSSPVPRLAGCLASELHFCALGTSESHTWKIALPGWWSNVVAFPFEPPRSGVRGKAYHKHDFTSSSFLRFFVQYFSTRHLNAVFSYGLGRKIIFTNFRSAGISGKRGLKSPATTKPPGSGMEPGGESIFEVSYFLRRRAARAVSASKLSVLVVGSGTCTTARLPTSGT